MTLLDDGSLQLLQEGSNIPVKGTPAYQDLIGYANSCFNIAKMNRMQFERQWYLNIAFYFGRQYVNWSTNSIGPNSRLIEPSAPQWRVRITSNQIRRYIRKEFAKSTQETPTGFVLPASGDDSDLQAAKAGDAIIEYLFRELKFKREMRRAVFWAHLCGTSFIKDWYNRADPAKDSLKDLPGIEKVSPWHLYVPDVTQEEIESQEFVIQVSSKSKHFVQQIYKRNVEPTGTASSGLLEEKFLQAMGITERKEKDQVHIKEGWFKPGSKFEDGAVMVWSDNEILYLQEGWPYEHKEFPFSKIDHISTGRFYSESIITDLIPLQKEYNRTRSQIIEAKNRMAKPQLRAPTGSIDANKITSEPGLIVFYRPGFDKPEPLPLQGLPNYVIEELNRCKMDMDDISSQHEVSRGQAPPGVEAATAISYLQEQDDSVLGDLVFSIEQATEKLGRHLLAHVNQNWDEARKIQVVGLNQQLEAFEFSKANLQGNNDYVVQSGSATPRSQAGKQAFIIQAMNAGWIPPAQGFKYLEMSETGRMYEDMQIDARHAQRENLKMSQGVGLPEQIQLTTEEQATVEAGLMEPPPPQPAPGFPVNTWDNHIVHITEHDNWRKRQEYEQSPDEIKALFEQHDRMHKVSLCFLFGIPIPMGDINPETGQPDIDPMALNSIAWKIMNGIPVLPPGPSEEPGVASEGGQ